MIIVDIIDKWPRSQVTSGDIVTIRDKVMRNYFTGAAGLSDNAVIFEAGEAWEEMLFLHLYLDYVNSQKAKGRSLSRTLALQELIERQQSQRIQPSVGICNDEFHYIAEWLKKNRVNDNLVSRNSLSSLRVVLADAIYEWCEKDKVIQDETKRVVEGEKIS